LLYFLLMGVLEIIADRKLSSSVLDSQPGLRASLSRVEKSAQQTRISPNEKARLAALIELCFEYEREKDPEEKENILRTLAEISANEPLEMPSQKLDEWESDLKINDPAYKNADKSLDKRIQGFLKRYFSSRAKSGFKTQAAVAKASGLKRSYVAVIETGEHFPQQKTLQKLAKAFAVDVSDLLP
jgi:DNA-binding XRE family transcriptional regulator